MFIAALFTIAKLWNQPRCSPTDEWTKKIWYIFTTDHYSMKIMSFARKWMELENHHVKQNKPDSGRQNPCPLS
jgi:hypothetical protein